MYIYLRAIVPTDTYIWAWITLSNVYIKQKECPMSDDKTKTITVYKTFYRLACLESRIVDKWETKSVL